MSAREPTGRVEPLRPRKAEPSSPLPLVIAMSGATGVIYGIRLLEVLRDAPVETHLIMSEWAARTIVAETTWKPGAVQGLADHVHEEGDLSASPASGSFLTAGMMVVPCSMKSLADRKSVV